MSTQTPSTPRRIYLYLVCLITLVMAIVATVNTVKAIVELAYPEPVQAMYPKPVIPEGIEDDEATIAARQAEAETQMETQRLWAQRRAVLNLVSGGTMLLLAVPIYIYHWRKIERETPSDEENSDG